MDFIVVTAESTFCIGCRNRIVGEVKIIIANPSAEDETTTAHLSHPACLHPMFALEGKEQKKEDLSNDR